MNEMTEPNQSNQNLLDALIADPMLAVSEFYASCLAAHPRATEFVQQELGLDAAQASERRIGFADRSLGTQIPSRRIRRGREVRERLLASGLYKGNGRETLRGRVTEPMLDEAGRVIGLRGYPIDPHLGGEAVVVVLASETASDQHAAVEEPPVEQQAPAEEAAAEETAPVKPTNLDSELTIEDEQILFRRDDREYRVRGFEKNRSSCQLKVAMRVRRDSLVHLDSLDLVKARSRASFIKAAATELYVDADLIKKDIGTLLLKLETLQAQQIRDSKQPSQTQPEMSDTDRRDAMQLLRDPQLLQRIVADIDACGTVGESTNKLAGYLAATSRKLPKPLAVVIQSSSSAGKTSLMDAILAMMPEEEVQRYSGMTGQSLFYLDSRQIRHKILAIAEDEGVRQATYALKLLQSEGELRHATVGRGEDGRSQTQEHHVEGPVQIFLTTTAMDIDEELVNRCFVLSVDETDGQTDAIQSQQRHIFTSERSQADFVASRLRALHQNAQRLLEDVTVFNPYAPQLTFPTHKTRMRRDHVKYLTLINTIALLHQHQRTIHQTTHEGSTLRYINVEPRDIAVANGIAGEVLGRSLDELSPQTRTLLGKLQQHVDQQAKSTNVPHRAYRFTRRELRQAIHWSDSQLRKHLNRLVDLEYVLVHRGRNGQRYVYELLYSGEGREGQPFLMGLIDPAKLKEPASAHAPMTQTSTP